MFYDWYINDIKAGIYKRQGHKRMLQELQIATISRVPRTSIELFKRGGTLTKIPIGLSGLIINSCWPNDEDFRLV